MNQGPVAEQTGAPATDRAELEALVGRLSDRKDAWVRTGPQARIDYLQSCIEGVWQVAEAWVGEGCEHAGVDPSSALAGELWLSGPMVTADALRQYVGALREGGQPRPRRLGQAANGQIVAHVMPRGIDERFLFHNMTAEVWIEPGQPSTQGRIYREKAAGNYPPGRVALVLGGGNVSSIGPLDLLYKLFVEDQVVLLKMHPVNDYLGPQFEQAFAALIRDGYLAVVYGGREVGDYLCRHPAIGSIHLTGSDRTHDAIVWGADSDEQAERKAAGRPRIDKQVTSELGCVTPILVVPGDWSDADLDFQARHVAAMVAHNASFDCNAGQVLVLSRNWPARERFLERTRRALASAPPRRAYYPGALERYAAFCKRYPAAEALGGSGPDVVPWTLIPDVPAERGEYALTHEAFCGLIAEVSLDSRNAPEFLEQAVELCNESIWGTLSCALLVDRATRRANRIAVERAIAELRYGSIGLNVWPGVNFALSCTSWGAFPGHPPENIVSGSGVVHNTLLFDHPQKSVVRSHFRIRPKPIWFPDHRTLDVLGRHLTAFAVNRSPWSLIRVALAGMRG